LRCRFHPRGWFQGASVKSTHSGFLSLADEQLAELLQDTSEALMEIEERCDNDSAQRHHLTLVASGLPCLAWVSVPMNPSAYISDMINSIPVFGDKILREFAGDARASAHAAFVQRFRDMLRGLNEHVRAYHTKGVSWNMEGDDFSAWLESHPPPDQSQ
jgi:adenylyl cyclase-associated protein